MSDLHINNNPSPQRGTPKQNLDAPNIEINAALSILRLAREAGDLVPEEEERLNAIEAEIEKTSVKLVSALRKVLNLSDSDDLSSEAITKQIESVNKDKLYRILHISGVRTQEQNSPEVSNLNIYQACHHISKFIRKISYGLVNLAQMQKVAAIFEYDRSVPTSARVACASVNESTSALIKETLELFNDYRERVNVESIRVVVIEKVTRQQDFTEEVKLNRVVERDYAFLAVLDDDKEFHPIYEDVFERLAADEIEANLLEKIVCLEYERDAGLKILTSAKSGDLTLVRDQIQNADSKIVDIRQELRSFRATHAFAYKHAA